MYYTKTPAYERLQTLFHGLWSRQPGRSEHPCASCGYRYDKRDWKALDHAIDQALEAAEQAAKV